MEEMMIMGKKKSKKKAEPDYSQYDETYHWTKVPKVKRDKNFFGHMKVQTLF